MRCDECDNTLAWTVVTCRFHAALILLLPSPTPTPPSPGYPYRGLNGNSADAPGSPEQCDHGFLTGQAAKQGSVQISGSPVFTAVPASKLGLITALASQPLVASIGVDPSFQHYAGGIWSSPDCNGEPAGGVVGGVSEALVWRQEAGLPPSALTCVRCLVLSPNLVSPARLGPATLVLPPSLQPPSPPKSCWWWATT